MHASMQARPHICTPPLWLGAVQALLNSSHMYYDAAKHFSSYGVSVSGLTYDWGQMQKQKDDAVAGLTKGIEGLFKKNKVCVFWGGGTRVSVTQHSRV